MAVESSISEGYVNKGRTADMVIVFSNGVIFEQFMPASRKNEEWRLIDYNTDEQFVCYDEGIINQVC